MAAAWVRQCICTVRAVRRTALAKLTFARPRLAHGRDHHFDREIARVIRVDDSSFAFTHPINRPLRRKYLEVSEILHLTDSPFVIYRRRSSWKNLPCLRRAPLGRPPVCGCPSSCPANSFFTGQGHIGSPQPRAIYQRVNALPGGSNDDRP